MLWGFLVAQKINNKMRKFIVLEKYKYHSVNTFFIKQKKPEEIKKKKKKPQTSRHVISGKYFFRMKYILNHIW